jgi:hypothetical protein
MNSIWEFYKKHFLTLFAVSFAMALVLQYLASMIDMKEIETITDPMQMLEKMKDFLVPILLISLANLLFATILQHYILYNPVDKRNTLLSSFIKALKYFIPYLIIMVLLVFFGSVAILLGLIAFVIGAFFAGLYVMMLYFFILPILMVEGINIGRTIGRTFTLAHSNFWTNIGWVAVFMILLIVISVIFSAILMLPFAGDFIKLITDPESAVKTDYTTNPLYIILSALLNAFTFPLMPIFSSLLYMNAKAGEDELLNAQQKPEEPDKITVRDLYPE